MEDQAEVYGNTNKVNNKGVKDPNPFHKCETCQSRYVVSINDQTCANCGHKYQKQEQEPTTEEKNFEKFIKYCEKKVKCANKYCGVSIYKYIADDQKGMCYICYIQKNNGYYKV